MKHTKGFTLIELLVVISIIGVLSTLIFTSIQEARFKAQITKTISDLTTIEKAFQMMIISEDMDCWPRERVVNTDASCSFALATTGHLVSGLSGGGNVTGPALSSSLTEGTSNLNNYLPTAPEIPFPLYPASIGYRYDNDNNIYDAVGCSITGHNGVNITLHFSSEVLRNKIFNELRQRFFADQFGCGKIRRYSTHTIFYSLAYNPNRIEF